MSDLRFQLDIKSLSPTLTAHYTARCPGGCGCPKGEAVVKELFLLGGAIYDIKAYLRGTTITDLIYRAVVREVESASAQGLIWSDEIDLDSRVALSVLAGQYCPSLDYSRVEKENIPPEVYSRMLTEQGVAARWSQLKSVD